MRKNNIIWIIAMFLLAAALVNAGSYNPETYWGYVYIEGNLVPAGTILTLESTNTGEIFANQTIPYDIRYPGSYSIILNFDDAYTPQDEGASLNESLTWKVNGIPTSSPAPEQDKAETGKTNNNFRIDAILNPLITATLQQSAISLYLGQSVNITVILNNTGTGSGNATLTGVNLTSDLPKTVYVSKNNYSQSTFTVTPSVCGQQTSNITINYYNLAGTLVSSLSNQFSLNVTGADLILEDIKLSNSSLTAGNTISITSRINNTGTTNITGFTAKFYYDSTLIDTITSNEVLSPAETVGISANWIAVEGTHTINITISTTGTECYTTNNGKTTNVIILAASSQTTPTVGGGGGNTESNTNINNTIKNETNENNKITGEVTKDITPPINETSGETQPPVQEQPKKTGGFIPIFTGFVAAVNENKINWFLIILIIIMCTLLTYKLILGIDRQEQKKIQQPKQQQHRIRIDVNPRREVVNIPKQEKQMIYKDKPVEIQKSIKISSKKDILDKLKEVYKEDG